MADRKILSFPPQSSLDSLPSSFPNDQTQGNNLLMQHYHGSITEETDLEKKATTPKKPTKNKKAQKIEEG